MPNGGEMELSLVPADYFVFDRPVNPSFREVGQLDVDVLVLQ